MKILWSSNAPYAKTGYGQQTSLFLPRLAKLGHELAAIAWYGLEGGALNWNGIMLYPKGAHLYGEDMIGAHASHFQADIAITLIDAWVCEPKMHEKVRWVPWFPVDSEPLPRPVLDKIKESYQPIVYSRFGQAMCEAADISPLYVPHGVDTAVFKPHSDIERREAREKTKLPADAFIVGMVAANKDNPSRKCFPENLTAFANFHKRHPDSVLYLHTNLNEHGKGGGVNIAYLLKELGLEVGKDAFFTNSYAYYMGLSDLQMATLYNAFDVLLGVSMGEGFGVPLLEAQACGVPVIAGNWTAMPENVFGGWLVEKDEAAPIYNSLGSYWWLPRVEAIEDRLEQAYYSRAVEERSDACVKGAAAFDADKVAEDYWKPALEQIAGRVEANKKLFSGANVDHVHKWAVTGLYIDGKLCQPCLVGKCDCALEDGQAIVPGVFPSKVGELELDIEDDPDGGVSKFVMYECAHSYKLDALDLQAGELCVDIGAHVGIVSIYLAKRYGVKVISFEPVCENFERLKRNIAANDVADLVIPFNMAVTADGRDVHMPGGSKVNSGGNNIYASQKGEVVKSLPVAIALGMRTGGTTAEPIALLKLDCEGAEYEILEGHYELLDGIRWLIGELHFNNQFPVERMRRLTFEVTKRIGVDNTVLATTPIGDL